MKPEPPNTVATSVIADRSRIARQNPLLGRDASGLAGFCTLRPGAPAPAISGTFVLTIRGGDFDRHSGQDVSIGYSTCRGHQIDFPPKRDRWLTSTPSRVTSRASRPSAGVEADVEGVLPRWRNW